MDLLKAEKELKKRLDYPYRWGRKQSDDWDSRTNFIYNTFQFEKLLERISAFDQPLQNYAMNRWFNFISAMAVEYIFTQHSCVEQNLNHLDKTIDFKINNIPFDHKTSVFPTGFGKTIRYAYENQLELIKWLYENQSQQGRKHLKNRLFVILYKKGDHQHWKLKAEIKLLNNAIDNYIKFFSKENLKVLNFGDGKVLSDIIWVGK